jgi:hypothetical protein
LRISRNVTGIASSAIAPATQRAEWNPPVSAALTLSPAEVEILEARDHRVPIQPHSWRPGRLHQLPLPPRAQHSLLQRTLTVARVAEHQIAELLEPLAVALDKTAERLLVSGSRGREQRLLINKVQAGHRSSRGQTAADTRPHR